MGGRWEEFGSGCVVEGGFLWRGGGGYGGRGKLGGVFSVFLIY